MNPSNLLPCIRDPCLNLNRSLDHLPQQPCTGPFRILHWTTYTSFDMAFGSRYAAYGAALFTLFAQLGRSQSCQGQSCIVADVSGSTGQPFTGTVEPVYPQQGMECCIIHYNPAVKERLYQLVPSLAQTCPTAMIQVPMAPDLSNVQCKPKVLIFAAGTSESTVGGGTLGVDLQGALGSNWFVQGVNYVNDNNGNDCAGIPGGITAKNMLAAYATRCPNSALFMGGYSQGATVAHDASLV